MKTQQIELSKLKLNPDNPRVIVQDQVDKLKKSISEFPEMLELRPIVCTEDMTVIGGNMRVRAAMELGIKSLPVVIAKGLTPEQVNEFIIKDNLSYGQWDHDLLANEWDVELLAEWGLELPTIATIEPEVNDYEPNYQLIVECRDEAHQQRIYNQLIEQGEKCKPLTL